MRDLFERFVDPQIVEEIVGNPEKPKLGGVVRPVTVFNAGLRGSSAIAQMFETPGFVRVIAQIRAEITNVIRECQGIVDQYRGDTVRCWFGYPSKNLDHPYLACLAALRTNSIVHLVSEHLVFQGQLPGPIHSQIGLDTGEVFVGNIGCESRMDYTVIGREVSRGQLLKELNRYYGTSILIGADTEVAVRGKFAVRMIDRIGTPGLPGSVRIFELVGETRSLEVTVADALGTFRDGIADFERREWELAETKFKQVLKSLPQDGPSRTYVARCNAFRKRPPPDAWDGVFRVPFIKDD